MKKILITSALFSFGLLWAQDDDLDMEDSEDGDEEADDSDEDEEMED